MAHTKYVWTKYSLYNLHVTWEEIFRSYVCPKLELLLGGGYFEMLGPAGIGDSWRKWYFSRKRAERYIFISGNLLYPYEEQTISWGLLKYLHFLLKNASKWGDDGPWVSTHMYSSLAPRPWSKYSQSSFLPSFLHSFIPSPFLKPSRGRFSLEISTSTIGRNGALRHPNTSRNPSLLGRVFPFDPPGTHCQQQALMQDGSQRRGLDWDLAYRSSGITAERFPKDRG